MGDGVAPLLLRASHLDGMVTRWWRVWTNGSVQSIGWVNLLRGWCMSCDRARGESGQRIAIRPRASVTTMDLPLSWVERCRRNNLSNCTSWSISTGVLQTLSFPGASYSCFGHRGGDDDDACVDHVPRSVHTPIHLHSPRCISGRM